MFFLIMSYGSLGLLTIKRPIEIGMLEHQLHLYCWQVLTIFTYHTHAQSCKILETKYSETHGFLLMTQTTFESETSDTLFLTQS